MKYKCTAVITLSILLLCLFSFLVPSLKMESSENRTMAGFRMVLHPQVDSVVYYDSPVERLDAALSDQFPFREAVVKGYLRLFNFLDNSTFGVSQLFMDQQNQQYVLHSIGNYALIGDTGYITVFPKTDPMDKSIMKKRIDQLDFIHEKFPDLKIYVYFVTQAYDTPWFDFYIGAPAADHYQEILDVIPKYVKSDHLVYQDLEDYMNSHYKTDHHWNHRGARRGYEDIYSMMSKDIELGKILIPESENEVSKTFDFVYLGSYGQSLGKLYDKGYDDFSFYEYNFPQSQLSIMTPYTMEEIEASKIGLYDEYRSGEIDKDIDRDHYITLYGIARDKEGKEYTDSAYAFIIRNHEGNGKNLMICGDSYSRALRDPLASHFDTTVYLDYRILSSVSIDDIIEKYHIDMLLISSNASLWNSEEYLFKFKGDN